MTTPLFTRRAGLAGGLAGGLLAVLDLPGSAQAGPVRASIGQAAPGFALWDQQGRLQRLEAQRGRVVVLEWTNHACPFVNKHYGSGNMQRLQLDAAARGIVWFSVISAPPGTPGAVSPEEARALTELRRAMPAAVLLDPSCALGRAYGATTTPDLFVIDREGLLRYRGGIDSIPSTRTEDIGRAEALAWNAMRAVDEGRQPAPAVTRNYGCAIKYPLTLS